MFEAGSCSLLRLAENPVVDCTALQGLKTLLQDGVLEDRHSSLGGADADPQDSAPTPAIGVVSSAARADRLAQVARRDSAKGEDPVSQAASRIRANPAAAPRGEGRQP